MPLVGMARTRRQPLADAARDRVERVEFLLLAVADLVDLVLQEHLATPTARRASTVLVLLDLAREQLRALRIPTMESP